MLKESKGTFEKEIDGRVDSDTFKVIENHRFVRLLHEKLL